MLFGVDNDPNLIAEMTGFLRREDDDDEVDARNGYSGLHHHRCCCVVVVVVGVCVCVCVVRFVSKQIIRFVSEVCAK